MNFDDLHDPNPPHAGIEAFAAVASRAKAIRRRRTVLATATSTLALAAVIVSTVFVIGGDDEAGRNVTVDAPDTTEESVVSTPPTTSTTDPSRSSTAVASTPPSALLPPTSSPPPSVAITEPTAALTTTATPPSTDPVTTDPETTEPPPSEPPSPEAVVVEGGRILDVGGGTPAEEAITRFTERWGPPTADSGWQPRLETGWHCGFGPEERLVRWGGLEVVLANFGSDGSSPPLLTQWRYSGVDQGNPAVVLTVRDGVSVGSLYEQVLSAYPDSTDYGDEVDLADGSLRLVFDGDGRVAWFAHIDCGD